MKKEYSLQIYKPNGENTDIELRKYQYNGSFMGERNITASISSPVKINWEIGDYVIFRNEPFTLRYVPPVKKQSRRGTFGEGYIYDGIVFSSIISQLVDVQFLDYVSNDNNIHYTGLSNFAFYVSNNSLTEFASRIKANIERVYGKDSWDVIVANKGVIIKDEDNNVIVEGSSFEFDDQSISITSGTSIYNAICLINTQLELNFLIRIVNGRKTIILGGSSVATAESLGYGKGRGLKSIQQSHNNNDQIVTRLHAYGSSRNLPYRYYNKKYNDKNKYPKMFDSNGNYLLESRYINKLMLPYKCWVQTSYIWDAFIQSKLADVIGIKEGEVTFDGSDEEWDEIYPSLEKQSVNDWEVGMTMYDSGYREYSETMRNRFLFNTRQMTSYGNTIEEIKKIFTLNTKNADDREQAKSILEDCKWTVTPGKEAYYEEAMKIIDEVWDGKDWEYKYDYAVQKTHKLSSTEKSNIKKYTYNGDGRLDRLPSGVSIKDNGVSSDGSYTDGSTDTNGTIINTTFEVIIPQLGFDIEDWVAQDGSKATVSVKTGMCSGREFPINSCVAVDVNDYSKGWKLNLDRHQDMEVNMIFPNSVYRLDAGDEYVLTGIYMPDVYVESAENRLYNQAVKYLSDIDHTKYTYSLDVDSKWMKEHEDVANLLYEGCSIVFNDFDSGDEMSGVGDLNIGEISVVATQVTISFNEEALPKYTIVLSDDKHTAVNLKEMISASVKSNTISYANSISLLEKKINDKLSKTEQDEAQELITFLKGIKTAGIENDGNNITKGLTKLYDAIMSNGFKNSMTAGSGWQIDKNGNAQVESIEVRSYMRVLELVMNRLSAEESEFIFTESGTVEKVVMNDDGSYTLTMRKKTDKDITPFQQGDILKGVMNDLTKDGAVGSNFYTSWVQVKEVNQTDNSIKVAVYSDDNVPGGKNFPPCDLMVLHRWGNTTKKERQSCWYISSIEKRIVMLDGVTEPKLVESNYASFYGLPFDMENFKGYSLNKNQPYLYVRGAFLQDVCFIDYLGKVVKQERYRGVWSQEVANSNDPYIVTQTTFDTVYHKNAKWQCNSTIGSKVEPSESTTDWTKLSEGGKGSDGKSAAKAYVTSNDIAIPTDANGIVTEDFRIGNTFSLMVDGKNCTDLKVTMDETPATNAFKAQLNQLWLTITSSKGAEFGSRAYTLHFTVTGVLDNVTYSDVVTILVRPNRAGADGKNLTRVSNFYKWGTSGTEAPGGDYTENNIPEHVKGLDYLWNYEVCYNNAGETISTSEKTCIGNFARGIESITEYYQIGTAQKPDKPISVDTIDASGWKTIMPSLTAEKKYLWNLEVVSFTDGTYSISEVHLAGAQGDSITIEQQLVYYAISASGTSTPPDAWFSDTIKEPTEEKPYLWTCVSIRYSDTTVVKYYTVARRGENGAPGRNLTKVVNFYRWGASGTQAPSDGYTKDNIPPHTDGLDYLWNYEVCYSDNDVLSQSGKSCIGYFPKDGDPGKGIRSITEYYQIGTERKPTNGITVNSNNELDTTGWKTTMDPTTNENRFVWNQEVIQFTDGTYSISVIHLSGAQGDKGDKGADAKNLSLRCDRQVINCDETSCPWDDGNITIEAVLENLSGTVTWSIDWDNASGEEIEDAKYEIRGNVLEILDTYYFTGMCYNIYITARLGQYSAKTTIVVVNDGTNGKNGANGKPLVGPTEWSKDVRYLSGKPNEAYQSIVINPKYPKQMYLCGYTHTNVEPSASTSVSSVNTCTKDKPWVQVTYQDFVATKVLFADRGKIENLDITNATIQGTITDMSVKTKAEWDAITNSLVPNADKGLTEYERNFQIVDPSKAGSYFIPTIDPTSSNNGATVYERGPQIVFLPTYNPSTDYDIITSKITTSNTGKKRYNIPQYQIAGTHIRITKGGASRQYLRWAYIEDAEYDSLWNRNNGSNRQTICSIYNMGTLICADHKIFKVTDGNDEHGHEITGAWYYGDSDYKHGRLSVNGTVARMLWLMPGQTVELVSQIEEIYNKKCLVWSVVNSSDFTAVNVNADLYNRSSTYEPIKFHGESGILDPALAGNANNWEDCFMAHRKIDNLLLGGVTKELPRLFINRNGSTYDNGNPIAFFYIP